MEEQFKTARAVWLEQFSFLGIHPTDVEFEAHYTLCRKPAIPDRVILDKADAWLSKLKTSQEMNGFYPEPAFSRVLAEHWLTLYAAADAKTYWLWSRMSKSPLRDSLGIGMAKIVITALIHAKNRALNQGGKTGISGKGESTS